MKFSPATVLIALLCYKAAFADDLVASDKPFSSSGTVTIKDQNVPGFSRPENFIKTEQGMMNGVAYSFFYSDGSGTFAGTQGNTLDPSEDKDSNWSVQCAVDAMTDERRCFMQMNFLVLVVFSSGPPVVLIGQDHDTSVDVMIRIDAGKPISAHAGTGPRYRGQFSAETSAKIIKRLKQAQTIVTRHRQFGRGTLDRKWNLYGFNEAFAYINWAVAHIK